MSVSVIIELPESLLSELREIAQQQGIPLEQVVEEALSSWAAANVAMEQPSWDWEKIRPLTSFDPKPN